MRTCEIVKLLLKAAGVGVATGLTTTATVIGATGLGRSIVNISSHIPADADKCLDKLLHQRKVDTQIVLWNLLAFTPGFFFGALYYLYKQTNSCTSSTWQYETIEDGDQQHGLKEFCHALVTSDNSLLRALKICLTALIAGLATLGAIYSIVTPLSGTFDRDSYESENCHFDTQRLQIVDLVECVLVFTATFSIVLWANLQSPQNQTRVASQTPSQVPTPYLPNNDAGPASRL